MVPNSGIASNGHDASATDVPTDDATTGDLETIQLLRWDAMQPRERDGFIARAIFGWADHMPLVMGVLVGNPPKASGGHQTEWEYVPFYSQSLNHAWMLFERIWSRLVSRKIVFTTSLEEQLQAATGSHTKVDPMWLLHLLTPDMICRATLLAYGYDLENLGAGAWEANVQRFINAHRKSPTARRMGDPS